ncbi:MAG: adenylosuccinate lyase [Candidatus Diapherotrites archaeon]|uniref:Adenylosuccinate lyase n=1 Tax=Candidatus Iainarchaeum sp. TaxID=3101447 RepID=A0A2D6M169_9ARCH|nr:adenylosuccinate lyase [Candidatus Diapherotrites archaeon]
MSQFDNISPLDYRYYSEEFKKYLSEEARIAYQSRVEVALAKALAAEGICSAKIAKEIEDASKKVTAQEVYEGEKKTRHDIRALVNSIRDKVSDEAKPFVHLTSTSYDIVDTSNALRYKEATEELVLLVLRELEKTLIEIALREKGTIQIGRTHGQHAEPITFGFAVAGYVSRLGNRIKQIETAKDALVGKFSGAVGAYNASSLLVKDAKKFEERIMTELGLGVSPSSTQIVEPEPTTDLMHAFVSAFGILANFSDDMRNLQRSEIAEVGEAFEKNQVGSSTMPHKRNPINFENVKSFYKEFMPRMFTVYLDQISEHQRDLTNSASQRFIPEIMAGLVSSAKRLNKVCSKMVVDKENMERNFMVSSASIVAEPLYILLAFHGHPDAHETVKQLTLRADKEGTPLMKIVDGEADLKPYLAKFSAEQKGIIADPKKYIGLAEKKTELLCNQWKKELGL